MIPRGDILIVATSATPHRDYRTEFLNAFAYPKGHHVFFRYRARWIADDIRRDLNMIDGARAVLVFCDPQANGDFEFHPVRYCKIVKVDIPNEKQTPKDDDHVVLRIELKDFVHQDLLIDGDVHPAFRKMIRSQSDRPYPLTSSHGQTGKFLFVRTAPATFDLETSGVWYRAANALSKVASLNAACLMHISQLREVQSSRWWRGEKLNVVQAVARDYGLVYELSYDRSYMLGLEFLPRNDRYLSVPQVAPPIASVSMPFRRFLPEFIVTDVLLSPLRSDDGRCGLQVPGTDSTAASSDDVPRAVLMLEIKGRRAKVLLNTAIFGAGLVLQTFPDLIQSLVLTALHLPTTDASLVKEVIKGFGVLVSVVGVLFGLKQLPSFSS